MRPDVDFAAIDRYTAPALAQGMRLLQPWRLHEDDHMHCWQMLADLHPARGACVLDIGCGVGEVARLMAQDRLDLTFILCNKSELQLANCPKGERFKHLHADAHALPLPDACVDAVMFAASLCQMERMVALREARRVAKGRAPLLLYEMVATHPLPQKYRKALGLELPSHVQLLDELRGAGWGLDWFEYPRGDDAHFRELLRADGLEGFAECVRHIVVRALA